MKAAQQGAVTRRQVLAGAVCLSAAALGAATRTSQGAAASRTTPTINVKTLGAVGDGRQLDAGPIREAIRIAGQKSDGATIFFPPGDYYLGAAADSTLLHVARLVNVRFVGERATLSCRSGFGDSTMVFLAGCRNITVEGLRFRDHGLDRNVSWLGAAAIRIGHDGVDRSERIHVKDCVFESVLGAVGCPAAPDTVRSREIVLTNLTVSRSYYGFVFQNNGDDVTARNLRCNDVQRSYFPYGVSRHDIEIETLNNATGFNDILLSCDRRDTSDLRVKVKCRGKRGGDGIVTFGHNDIGHAVFRNISVDVDIDDVDCGLATVFLFRSLDAGGKWQRATTRRWQSISIDGHVRICDRTKLIEIGSVPKTTASLSIGPQLARHPRLPRNLPGFDMQVARS